MRGAWVLVALVGVLCMGASYACVCAPAHPQDQFCRAAFVIKASIVGSEYIYKPTQKPVTEPPTTTTEAPTQPSSDYSSVFGAPDDFVLDNLAEVPAELPRLPPQGGLIPPAGLSAFPGLRPMYLNGEEDKRPIKMEYTIKVEKVFKGDNYLLERTLAKIYTPPDDGLCGQTDLTQDTSYIIAGTFYDNELRISTCSWVVPYKSLTKIQRRGLRLMYKQACDDCTIAPCYASNCKKAQPGNDMCMFNIHSMGDSCEAKHSTCSRSKKSCRWQRTRDYKKCLSEGTGMP